MIASGLTICLCTDLFTWTKSYLWNTKSMEMVRVTLIGTLTHDCSCLKQSNPLCPWYPPVLCQRESTSSSSSSPSPEIFPHSAAMLKLLSQNKQPPCYIAQACPLLLRLLPAAFIRRSCTVPASPLGVSFGENWPPQSSDSLGWTDKREREGYADLESSCRVIVSCRDLNIEACDNINLQNFKSEGRACLQLLLLWAVM